MKTWSLRWQLTFWSAAVAGLALLTFGVGAALNLYWQQRHALDERLEAQAKLFFRTVPGHGPVPRSTIEQVTALLRTNGELRGFAFGPPSGRPEHVSTERIAPLVKTWPPARKAETFWQDKRLVRVAVVTRDGRTLALFASQHALQETLAELFGAYLVAFPVVLLIVAGGSWWLARRALQPIVVLTNEAAAITASRLDRRLSAPAVDDEIGRHVRVLNAMFDRLQAGFEQATRFTADASHELRTPLTILRGEIETALHANDAATSEKLLLDLLEQTIALQKITDNLLLLARFDAGKLPLAREPVDFSRLVAEAAEDAGLLAARSNVNVTSDISPALHVTGDALLLRRVLLNLVDNAVRYNRPGGELALALQRESDTALFRIRNTGPGIPAVRRGAIFERFFRADDDRNRASGGSGLGLSLCREIVTAHGGTILLAVSEADATEFHLRLPAREIA